MHEHLKDLLFLFVDHDKTLVVSESVFSSYEASLQSTGTIEVFHTNVASDEPIWKEGDLIEVINSEHPVYDRKELIVSAVDLQEEGQLYTLKPGPLSTLSFSNDQEEADE